MADNGTYCSITGHVGRDPEVKSVKGNTQTLVEFSVAVKSGPAMDAPVTWYQVADWKEARREAVTTQLYKGARVCVEGFVRDDVYQGKVTKKMWATSVGLVQWLGGSQSESARTGRQAAQQYERRETGVGTESPHGVADGLDF